ncbi:MAG: outer membrane beta-barrel protein, partial [Burkholderiales bacterium]|nr:outer membrane beta-barrel protein [Burkholderiales bacterium]
MQLSYALQRDDNIYRLPSGIDSSVFGIDAARKADTVSRASVELRLDKALGRQRALVNASVEHNSYRNNPNLDHPSGNLRASWRWVVGNLWDGDASFRRQRFLSGFADIRTTQKNLVDQETAGLSARHRFHPRWNASGSLEDSRRRNSQANLQHLDLHTFATTVGVNYVTPADNTAGLRLRLTHGEYPNRTAAGPALRTLDYDERELSGVVDVRLSGRSSLDARLGFTERRNRQATGRDYSGVTARGRYHWRPTGKIEINTSMYREIRTWENITTSYILATGIEFGPTWALSDKVRLLAGLNYETRRFLGDPGAAPVPADQRVDHVALARIGSVYTPHRNVALEISYEQGRRSSNVTFQDFDYRAFLVS